MGPCTLTTLFGARAKGGGNYSGQRVKRFVIYALPEHAPRGEACEKREGDGRKGDKRRRRAWPHRTKHQEPDAARGAASEIPRKTGATGAPKGHAYNPAHAGANRGAVRGCFRTRHLHRDGRERQPSGRKISHVISSGTLAKQQVIEWTGDSLPVAGVEETDACMALILNSSQRSLLQAATQLHLTYSYLN